MWRSNTFRILSTSEYIIIYAWHVPIHLMRAHYNVNVCRKLTWIAWKQTGKDWTVSSMRFRVLINYYFLLWNKVHNILMISGNRCNEFGCTWVHHLNRISGWGWYSVGTNKQKCEKFKDHRKHWPNQPKFIHLMHSLQYCYDQTNQILSTCMFFPSIQIDWLTDAMSAIWLILD